MKEKTLLKLALICSLIGLIALFLISNAIELNDYKPGFNTVGDDVKVFGKVQKVSIRGGVTFLTIDYNVPTDVLLFTKENVKLKEGDYVEVEGKLDEYRGKEEIIAQKVKVG